MLHLTRRQFAKNGIGVAATLPMVEQVSKTANEPVRTLQPNETIRLGIIGVGNRGSQLISAFQQHDDCAFVAAADVYSPYLDRVKDRLGSELTVYEDYRHMLDRNDIDAIVIATPDHWHALQTIHSVEAGKDVYVEKPLSTTVVEGRAMVRAANHFGRIVQVGLQRRSMSVYTNLAEYLGKESIGHVSVSRAYRLNNMFPNGISALSESDVPKGLNWDLWLGPRPFRAYQGNIAPYKFRWWLGYSSQMGNWGVHYFDVIRWMLQESAPRSVVCVGGQYAVQDDRTIPDTAEAIFEMPGGSLLLFGQFEASSNPAMTSGEVEFRGTKGTIHAASTGYRVIPERAGQFQTADSMAEKFEFKRSEPNDVSTAEHARNFLDCVKSRSEPRCSVEEGHRSTVFAHLANISLETGERLDWDSRTEQFANSDRANELLHYQYRDGYELPTY